MAREGEGRREKDTEGHRRREKAPRRLDLHGGVVIVGVLLLHLKLRPQRLRVIKEQRDQADPELVLVVFLALAQPPAQEHAALVKLAPLREHPGQAGGGSLDENAMTGALRVISVGFAGQLLGFVKHRRVIAE